MFRALVPLALILVAPPVAHAADSAKECSDGSEEALDWQEAISYLPPTTVSTRDSVSVGRGTYSVRTSASDEELSVRITSLTGRTLGTLSVDACGEESVSGLITDVEILDWSEESITVGGTTSRGLSIEIHCDISYPPGSIDCSIDIS